MTDSLEDDILKAAVVRTLVPTFSVPVCMHHVGISSTDSLNLSYQQRVYRATRKLVNKDSIIFEAEQFMKKERSRGDASNTASREQVITAAVLKVMVRPVNKFSASICLEHVGAGLDVKTNRSAQQKVNRAAKDINVGTLVMVVRNRLLPVDQTPSSGVSVPTSVDLPNRPDARGVSPLTAVSDMDNRNDLVSQQAPTLYRSSSDSCTLPSPPDDSFAIEANELRSLASSRAKGTRSEKYFPPALRDHQRKKRAELRNAVNEAEKMASLKWLKEREEKSAAQVSKEVQEETGILVKERRIRNLANQGNAGKTPPRRGPRGKISAKAYSALVAAVISRAEIDQENGYKEPDKKRLADLVNLCVNSHEDEGKRDRQDLFDRIRKEEEWTNTFHPGKPKTQEARQIVFCTYFQVKDWLDNFLEFLVEHGLGVSSDNMDYETFVHDFAVHHKYDGDLLDEEEFHDASFLFYKGQLRRLLNLDETGLSLDGTDGAQGGRLHLVFVSTRRTHVGSSKQKNSTTGTLLAGVNGEGELLPWVLLLVSSAKSAETQRVDNSLLSHAKASVVCSTSADKNNPDAFEAFECTIGLNEKGGMDTERFEKAIRDQVKRVYPDAAPENGKWVIILTDCGPGRENISLAAELRASGFLLYPGLPNSTHITQILDQLFGYFKTIFRRNLTNMFDRRLIESQGTDPSFTREDFVELLCGERELGGHSSDEDSNDEDSKDENKKGKNIVDCMSECFTKDRVKGAWKKVRLAPFTSKCLESEDVRHEITTANGETDTDLDPKARELEMLEERNHTCCAILTAHGYLGNLLKATVKHRSAEALAKARHAKGTCERQEALSKAQSAGQKYRATGGDFLSSKDLFFGNTRDERKKRIAELKKMKENAADGTKVRTDIAAAQAKLANGSRLNIPNLKALIKSKGGSFPSAAKKPALETIWESVKEKEDQVIGTAWTPENEAELERLSTDDEPIGIEDTVLGRVQKAREQDLIANWGAISEEGKEQIRQLAMADLNNDTVSD